MSRIYIEERALFSQDLRKEATEYAEKKYNEGCKVTVDYNLANIVVISTYDKKFDGEAGEYNGELSDEIQRSL